MSEACEESLPEREGRWMDGREMDEDGNGAAYPVGVTGNCGHIYAVAWNEE